MDGNHVVRLAVVVWLLVEVAFVEQDEDDWVLALGNVGVSPLGAENSALDLVTILGHPSRALCHERRDLDGVNLGAVMLDWSCGHLGWSPLVVVVLPWGVLRIGCALARGRFLFPFPWGIDCIVVVGAAAEWLLPAIAHCLHPIVDRIGNLRSRSSHDTDIVLSPPRSLSSFHKSRKTCVGLLDNFPFPWASFLLCRSARL